MSENYYIDVTSSTGPIVASVDHVPHSKAVLRFINPGTGESEDVVLPEIVVAHNGDHLVGKFVAAAVVG